MAESKREEVKSPQEIEEGIKSVSTVAWDPFSILPKEIYVKIFDKLDSPSDKRNFMNAHTKFYDLFKSNRTLFLFQDVLKEIGKKEEKPKFTDYQECRLVCKDWDNGTQMFFQMHESHFTMEEDKEIWVSGCFPDAGVYEPCKSFHWSGGGEGEKDLKRFSVTHPPSKNPFFSRKITLEVYDWEGIAQVMANLGNEEGAIQQRSYRPSVDALLERYGCHIWHCKITILKMTNPDTNHEALPSIAKWLELLPELKTLEIYNLHHISKDDLKRFQDMQVVQPELKNLVFFKSYELEAVSFNKLFGNLKGLEKIHFQVAQLSDPFRDFELCWENLKEASFPLRGFEDFLYLRNSKPFPGLKKLATTLVFQYPCEESDLAYYHWPEWRMIFRILEDKFPALNDLTLRLPKPMFEKDKRAVIDQSLECQLNLKELKKLRVNVSNLCSLDFLSPCKALEELRVVLEHSEWGMEESMELNRLRRDEKIHFNMDFGNMWKSNIWETFPNLCKLKIWAWCESTRSLDRYTYVKIGEDRKYNQRSYEAEDEDESAVCSDSD